MVTRFLTRISMFLALALFALASHAQEVNPSEKVSATHSASELSELSSDQIQWLNFIGDESYVVSYMPDKSRELPDLKALDPSCSPTNINPFKAGIELGEAHQRFRLGNTGYVVIFYSESRTATLFDRKNKNSLSY